MAFSKLRPISTTMLISGLLTRSYTELTSNGEVVGVTMYVNSVDVYACTSTKVARHHTPASMRVEGFLQTQGPPIIEGEEIKALKDIF